MKNPRNPMKSEHCPGSTGEIPIPAQILPFILRLYYTDDGRLVIRRERVKGRKYFLANCSNGRLTLCLVPVSDPDSENNDDADDIGEVSCDYTEKETNLGAGSSIKRRKTVWGAESSSIKRRKTVGNGDHGDDIDNDDGEDTGEVRCDYTEIETNLGAESRIKRRKTVGNDGGGQSWQYCSGSRGPRLLGGGGTCGG